MNGSAHPTTLRPWRNQPGYYHDNANRFVVKEIGKGDYQLIGVSIDNDTHRLPNPDERSRAIGLGYKTDTVNGLEQKSQHEPMNTVAGMPPNVHPGGAPAGIPGGITVQSMMSTHTPSDSSFL
jgi:hypothetical protein